MESGPTSQKRKLRSKAVPPMKEGAEVGTSELLGLHPQGSNPREQRRLAGGRPDASADKFPRGSSPGSDWGPAQRGVAQEV